MLEQIFSDELSDMTPEDWQALKLHREIRGKRCRWVSIWMDYTPPEVPGQQPLPNVGGLGSGT